MIVSLVLIISYLHLNSHLFYPVKIVSFFAPLHLFLECFAYNFELLYILIDMPKRPKSFFLLHNRQILKSDNKKKEIEKKKKKKRRKERERVIELSASDISFLLIERISIRLVTLVTLHPPLTTGSHAFNASARTVFRNSSSSRLLNAIGAVVRLRF